MSYFIDLITNYIDQLNLMKKQIKLQKIIIGILILIGILSCTYNIGLTAEIKESKQIESLGGNYV